jgi:hypothetical protein
VDAALKAGNAVVVIATKAHLNGLLARLQERGGEIAAALGDGRYLPIEVAQLLSTFMVNGLPDPARFRNAAYELVAAAFKAAKSEHRKVVACGECAPTLWAQGQTDAAIQLEHLWDGIAKRYDVDTLCGYVLTSFRHEHKSEPYERICAEHSTLCSH